MRLIESIYAGDDRLPLERKLLVYVRECLNLCQFSQHEKSLCPGCQPGVSHVMPQVGEKLVELTHIDGVCLSPDVFLGRMNLQGGESELEVRPQIQKMQITIVNGLVLSITILIK